MPAEHLLSCRVSPLGARVSLVSPGFPASHRCRGRVLLGNLLGPCLFKQTPAWRLFLETPAWALLGGDALSPFFPWPGPVSGFLSHSP